MTALPQLIEAIATHLEAEDPAGAIEPLQAALAIVESVRAEGGTLHPDELESLRVLWERCVDASGRLQDALETSLGQAAVARTAGDAYRRRRR